MAPLDRIAANFRIKEYDLNMMHGMDHVRALLDHLSDVAKAARQAIKECASLGDDATADVFTEIVRTADKDIYFLQSHLQGGITTYVH